VDSWCSTLAKLYNDVKELTINLEETNVVDISALASLQYLTQDGGITAVTHQRDHVHCQLTILYIIIHCRRVSAKYFDWL